MDNASSDSLSHETVVSLERVENLDVVDHEEVVSTTVNDEEKSLKRKRARKGKSDPNTWTMNSNKLLRMEGKAYKGDGKDSESGKVSHCVDRPERIQDTPNCGKSKTRKCHQISLATRKETFEAYWGNMNWEQKKIYVSSLVEKCKSSSSKVGSESRRLFSYKYFLRNGQQRIQVCQNIFSFHTRNW